MWRFDGRLVNLIIVSYKEFHCLILPNRPK